MTNEIEEKTIRLKVMEATQEDIDKGVVRIDSYALKDLGIKAGDIVKITGNDQTVAIATRAYPADVGLGIIRMDGLARRNAGTSLGDYVNISKVDVKPAKRVTIAPVQKGVTVQIMGQPTALKRALLGRPVIKGDVITLGGTSTRKSSFSGSLYEDIFRMFENAEFSQRPGTPFGMGGIKFAVVTTTPKDAVLITDQTEIVLKPEAVEIRDEVIPEVSYEDIGGLEEEINKIREMVELPLKHPELFQRLGIDAPKGVLLYGPPGTGKTLLAKAVANESNAHFISLNGPEIMSKWVGEAEKKLRKVFEDANENAPSIIFIDEIDSIAPKREEVSGEVERRVVAQLLSSMDGLSSRGKVIVIAATNRQNAIDPALRRPGRFDREIEIGVPDKTGREIIFKIHTRNMPLAEDVDVKFLANSTHGFVGADVEAVCKEAAMLTIRRYLPEIKESISKGDEVPQDILEKIVVNMEDFRGALRLVQPSAMREVLVEIPNVSWEDIGGLDKVKEDLRESVEWPLKHPDSFKTLGIRPPSGILLYGPPGCGKTLLAKAVATESEANFISIKGPELLSKWVGESERGLREIFRKARQVAPAVIFFDEIDSIASQRSSEVGSKVKESMVNQLLTEIDGIEQLNDVIVIAATNRPDMMDPGLLRPGRFDKMINVGVPDEKSRLKILEAHTRKVPLAKDVNLKHYAEKTEGFSGADLQGLVRDAAMTAIRRSKESKFVSKDDFDEVLNEMNPSLTKDIREFYEQFVERLKKSKTRTPESNYFG